jgi:hemerythrin
MKLFTWYEKYSVNNEELDGHHMVLFNILNKLYENCMANANDNRLDEIIEELVSYSTYHFIAEEQHMKNCGCMDIDKHVLEHRAFTERTLLLKQDLDKDDFEGSKELIVFLGNWLLHHVMEEDRKYSV